MEINKSRSFVLSLQLSLIIERQREISHWNGLRVVSSLRNAKGYGTQRVKQKYLESATFGFWHLILSCIVACHTSQKKSECAHEFKIVNFVRPSFLIQFEKNNNYYHYFVYCTKHMVLTIIWFRDWATRQFRLGNLPFFRAFSLDLPPITLLRFLSFRQ